MKSLGARPSWPHLAHLAQSAGWKPAFRHGKPAFRRDTCRAAGMPAPELRWDNGLWVAKGGRWEVAE